MESKCHKFCRYAKIHKFSKIYLLYCTYDLYVYVYKDFLLCLITAWERIATRKRWRKRKLNEMGVLNMEYKKWNKLDKSKRSSYNPVVFKLDCSLEIHLELWRKRAIAGHLCFSKNYKIILICIWILKSDYRFSY